MTLGSGITLAGLGCLCQKVSDNYPCFLCLVMTWGVPILKASDIGCQEHCLHHLIRMWYYGFIHSPPVRLDQIAELFQSWPHHLFGTVFRTSFSIGVTFGTELKLDSTVFYNCVVELAHTTRQEPHARQPSYKVGWLGLLVHFNIDTVHNYLSFVLLD